MQFLKISILGVNLFALIYVSGCMETFITYRKERESYLQTVMLQRKHVRHNPSHVKFVVPWQMHEVKQEKEDAK